MPPQCPRSLIGAPAKPCPMALDKLSGKPGCDWCIDNAESKYCFWYYMHLNKARPHTVTEISKLWKTSLNNVAIAERAAHAKISKFLK